MQVPSLKTTPFKYTLTLSSGYLNVDPTNNRNLFYWFVESQNNPATDPVVLWYGAPFPCGCFEKQILSVTSHVQVKWWSRLF
jgi:hypothetical protein